MQINNMKNIFLLIFITLFSTKKIVAQNDSANSTAKVYVIRSTGFKGSLVNLRIIIDDLLYCKIANNRYSVVDLKPGKYTFYVTSWDAPKKKNKLGLEIPVEAGKSYYLRIIFKERLLENQMFLEEITYNSAAPLISKYKEETNCIP